MIDAATIGRQRAEKKWVRKRGVGTIRCMLLISNHNKKKELLMATENVHLMLESVIGCKWSLTVISLVRRGVNRPGAMEHAIEGLSAKVLNERLVKLVRFGILEKTSYPEVPPRVEYRMTEFGDAFGTLLDQVDALERKMSRRPQ